MSFTKIAIRNIPRRKFRNLLTIVGITIGVAMLVGVNIATETTFQELRNYVLDISGRVDIIIISDSGAPFDQIKKDAAIRGISGVKATSVLAVQSFIEGNGTRSAATILGIELRDSFEYSDFRFDGLSLLGGREVTISKAIHERLGVRIGDFVTVKDVTGKERHTFHVIGIYHPKVEVESYRIYADLGFVQHTYGMRGKISSIQVSVDEMARTSEVRSQIEKNLGRGFKVIAQKEETISTWESNLSGWRQGLTTVSMLALFVSFGLVLNTMYMNIGERTYEVGVLRALGTQRRRIFWMFFFEALIMASIGVIIGVPSGIGIGEMLRRLNEGVFAFTYPTGLVVKPEYFASGAVAGFLATMVGGFIPSYSATRANILQALKPSMRPPGKRRTSLKLLLFGSISLYLGVYIIIEGIESYFGDLALITIGLVMIAAAVLRIAAPALGVILSPMKAVGKILSRNLGRNLKRSAITYATIGISVSFIVMIGGIQTSIIDSVFGTVREYFPADIIVFPSVPVSTTFSRDLKIADQAKIDTVTYLRFSGTKSGRTDIGIIAIDPNTFPKVFKDLEFTEDTPTNVYSLLQTTQSIILVEPLAQTLGMSVNSRIQVNAGSRIIAMNVVGIARGTGLSWMSMGGGFQMSQAAFVSFRTARDTFLSNDEKPMANIFMITLNDETYIDEVEKKIRAEYGRTYDLQTSTLNNLLEEISTTIQRAFTIFDAVLYMAILSATAGITATMMMNINERQREIGILRSLGMKRSDILGLIVGEALFLGFFGFLVGLPAGLLIFRGAVSAMVEAGTPASFLIPVEKIGLAFGLAILCSLLGVLYPSIRVLKAKPVEVLRYRG